MSNVVKELEACPIKDFFHYSVFAGTFSVCAAIVIIQIVSDGFGSNDFF